MPNGEACTASAGQPCNVQAPEHTCTVEGCTGSQCQEEQTPAHTCDVEGCTGDQCQEEQAPAKIPCTHECDSICQEMYLAEEGRYRVSAQYNAGPMEGAAFHWEMFYPDAVAQLFPIITKTIPARGARAQELYSQFCSHWEWEALAHRERGVTFYWGSIAYCAALMGDEARLDAYLARLESEVLTDFAYPAYNADMAWLVLACLERENQLEERILHWWRL